MNIDYIISHWLFEFASQSHLIKIITVAFAKYGIYLLLLFSIYVILKQVGERKKIYSFGFLAILIIAVRGITVSIIRTFYIRQRPFVLWNQHPLFNKIASSSFPSGHTAVMFAISFFIMTFSNKKWLIWISYIIALLSSIARVMSGVHWFSDIIASIVISALWFYILYKFIIPYKYSKKEENI